MTDALAARQQTICELLRRERRVARDVLEPFGRVASRILQLKDFDLSRFFVLRKRGAKVTLRQTLCGETIGERDSVLHRQLRSRTDREVRGVGGISQQHDILVHPAFVAHSRKVQPVATAQMGAICHQPMPAQVRREEPFAERERILRAGRVEAVCEPRLFPALDDERAQFFVEAIRVHGKPAVLGLLEEKREGVERQRRPEPNETA